MDITFSDQKIMFIVGQCLIIKEEIPVVGKGIKDIAKI